jgi:hypothetical protein
MQMVGGFSCFVSSKSDKVAKIKKTMKRLLLLFCLMPMLVSAQIVYVTQSGAGAANGTSWANAYADTQLQTALNTVPVGGQVWVAAGTYLPTYQMDGADARTKTFYIDRNIKVYGGFPATGSPTMANRNPGAYLTVLSGNIDFSGDNDAYHVMYLFRLPSTAIVDGLLFTKGRATGSTNVLQLGAGIFNDGGGSGNSSNPTIRNCIFVENTARSAAGIFNEGRNGGVASPTIANCSFFLNTVNSNGAAIYNIATGVGAQSNPQITDCRFIGNAAGNLGGAIMNQVGVQGTVSPIIKNCEFSNNTATRPTGAPGGGAIFLYVETGGKADGLIENCTFQNNSTRFAGGAIFIQCEDATSKPVVRNCKFSNNTATDHGGGVARLASFDSDANNYSTEVAPRFENCEFQGNHATFGGVVHTAANGGVCKPSFVNCTFYNNTATNYGGALSNNQSTGAQAETSVQNSIFYGNNAPTAKNISIQTVTSFALSHSSLDEAACPAGVTNCGTGNVYNVDPLFADAANGNLRLLGCSPLLNVGNNAANLTTKDLDNNTRKTSVIDMGAYEYQGQPFGSLTASATSTLLCEGGSLRLSVAGAGSDVTYAWAGPGFSSNIQSPIRPNANPSMSGTYSVTLSLSGCGELIKTVSAVVSPNIAPNITSIRVNNVSPNAQNTVAVCNNLPVTLNLTATNAVTYSWKGPTGSGSGFTSSLVSPVDMPIATPKTGQYTITVRNGCATFNHKVINIQLTNCGTRLANTEAMAEGLEMDISTYPNPVSDRLTVEVRLQTAQPLQLRLVNATGGQSGSWTSGEETTQHRNTLDLSQLPTGIYLLEAQAGQQRAVKRIVKQ